MIRFLIVLLLLGSAKEILAQYAHQPQYSTAGFYALPGTGRNVTSMNPGWRFAKGSMNGAEQMDYDDSGWETVSLPHGLEYLPKEASGCVNYQGEAWYRKHFDFKKLNKRYFLHFEGIMGKSAIWVNGKQVKKHYGGFLPAIADVTDYLQDGKNVISVMCDNGDDPMYPPGKPQDVLDFCYFGGVYRDCWLISHGHVFITDPNYEDEVAGGGLFISFPQISDKRATMHLNLHVRNTNRDAFRGRVTYELVDSNGKVCTRKEVPIYISPDTARQVTTLLALNSPTLWEPDCPYLYNLRIKIRDRNNKVIDGYTKRVGIRSIEFKGPDGFWLNGKPYPDKLIGANRHQDFAVIGNALPNSLHWKDAKKLRDAGMRIVRNAHYPQDPAFMDACDELGLFVIVNTPGWQFWNKDPLFAKRVYGNVRDMVRRDRNHPSVLLWEPILNETWYPEDFAKNVHDYVLEEYPYPGCYPACDSEAKGSHHFPIQFTHPVTGDAAWAIKHLDTTKTYFTREWGDNVDNWNSHNSPSRVCRSWGEIPMLVQAEHYAKPPYQYTCYNSLYLTNRHHVGGTLWHAFDHQRGYHPDPFYGGIMDAYRQPKTSYYMFQSQRPVDLNNMLSETGPMVYIANELTPFSPKDIVVYSNCDEVRVTKYNGKEVRNYTKSCTPGMPSPYIVFEGFFDVMEDKALCRERKAEETYFLAEGLINGEVVATHKRYPARRATKIELVADTEGVQPVANGSDIVVVVAQITDKDGNVKRLNNSEVRFTVEGEGALIEAIGTNPQKIEWGTAPILVRTTHRPGRIKISAELVEKGSQTPMGAELEIETIPVEYDMLYDENAMHTSNAKPLQNIQKSINVMTKEQEQLQKELNAQKLKEVERQQEEFGEKTK
ncbi:MAG: glycoside hydrolase family 2 TIM barrel-domain containing protein [Marinifilaceae bacterium]